MLNNVQNILWTSSTMGRKKLALTTVLTVTKLLKSLFCFQASEDPLPSPYLTPTSKLRYRAYLSPTSKWRYRAFLSPASKLSYVATSLLLANSGVEPTSCLLANSCIVWTTWAFCNSVQNFQCPRNESTKAKLRKQLELSYHMTSCLKSL